jgi:putative serine protease PepD
MVKRPRKTTALAALAGAALIGAGGGAATYAAFGSSDSHTVVRQVTVASSEPTSANTSLSVSQVYQRAHKGVVEITVTSAGQSGPTGESQTQQALGSGFVYDDSGHIVTNEHVVDGAQSITVRLWNGATYKATLVGSDSSTDLAVLKLDAPSSVLHPLALGDSSAVAVGQGVVAIGSPFGLEETVTSGIVSALHRSMQAPNNFTINDSIQTDAAINHGNSGGPLLDLHGKVIGVNAQIESDSGGSDGVGFAIPSNTVRSIASQLIANGNVQHAYLGVAVQAANGGVRVAQVRSGTPAQRAGLRVGDLVKAVNGKQVTSTVQLQAAIDARRPGDTVTIRFMRNGTSHTVQVRLATRPS